MIAAPACAPSACRAHTQDTCRPMYAVVRTVSEQVLWREHAALAQQLSKKIYTRHGAADKRPACAMVAVADYNDQRAVLAGLHAHLWEVHLRSLV
jgi:hypothetical protein